MRMNKSDDFFDGKEGKNGSDHADDDREHVLPRRREQKCQKDDEPDEREGDCRKNGDRGDAQRRRCGAAFRDLLRAFKENVEQQFKYKFHAFDPCYSYDITMISHKKIFVKRGCKKIYSDDTIGKAKIFCKNVLTNKDTP